MDVIENSNEYLFAKIGRQRPSVHMQKRNLETDETEEVLTMEDKNNKGIEVCTYFLLSYSTGIVSFIFTQGGPSENNLVNIIIQYKNQTHMMIIKNIVSTDTVRKLITNGSEISKISYSFSTPHAKILEHLKLSRKVTIELEQNEEIEVQLVVKNTKRRTPLAVGKEKIKSLVEEIKNINKEDADITKAIIEGKTLNSKSQKFLLDEEQNLNEKVIISYECDVNGNVKDVDKFYKEVYKKLSEEYEKNKKTLMVLSGDC